MASIPESLSTDRLELRRWAVTDLDEVMEAIEASIESLQPWMPWAADGVPTREDELTALRAGAVSFDRDADWPFTVVEAETGTLVGGCGLHRTDRPEQVEIGYWIRTDRQRRGYATEAAGALADAAFRHLPWVDEIVIRMDRANAASARVPEKLGFRLIDEQEQRPPTAGGASEYGLVWATSREEWNDFPGHVAFPGV